MIFHVQISKNIEIYGRKYRPNFLTSCKNNLYDYKPKWNKEYSDPLYTLFVIDEL